MCSGRLGGGEELFGEEPGEAGFKADQGSDRGGEWDTVYMNYSCQNYQPSDTSEAWRGNLGLTSPSVVCVWTRAYE